jgi:surface protein
LRLSVYIPTQDVGQDIYVSDEESFVDCTEAVFCTDRVRPNISEALGNRTNTNCGVVGIIGYCSSPAPSMSPSSSLFPSSRPSSQPSTMPSVVPGRQAFLTRTELNGIILSYLTLQTQALSNNVTARNELNTIIRQYGRMKDWDVSNINDMSSLFNGARVRFFNEDISRWNVSRVTTMRSMLSNTPNFNQNLSLWDVSKVTDMLAMFAQSKQFRGIGLEHWSTSKVQTMGQMFYDAILFNGNLSGWDTSRVTDMGWMFRFAGAFQGIGLEDWNTSQATSMLWMFHGAGMFKGNLSQWDVSKVTNMYAMFNSAVSFTGIDGNGIDSIGLWNVGKVLDFRLAFASAISFRANLTAWNVGNTSQKNDMFTGATSFPGVYWYP